ncbi:MAG: hypothetical protein AB7G05_09140 [Hyphomonadaceae bacterium]
MSESAWDIDEIDAETRAALEAAASERGITLDELIGDAVLMSLIEAEPDPDEAEVVVSAPVRAAPSRAYVAPAPVAEARVAAPARESVALNHRLEAIERKLAQTAASVEDAVTAADRAVIGIGARLDQAASEADAAHEAAEAAIAQLRAAVDALDEHIDHTATNLDVLARAHDTLRAQVLDDGALADQRLTVLEEVAASAESGVIALERAQDELRRAVASDFLAFAIETDEKLVHHAADMRGAVEAVASQAEHYAREIDALVDSAAERAEAGDARLLDDLNATRALFVTRLGEESQRLDQRINKTYDDAFSLAESLHQRLTDAERAHADLSDATRARFSEADGVVSAVAANLARSVEAIHTEFASDIGRVSAEQRDAIDHVRADLAFSIEKLRIEQSEGLEHVDESVRNVVQAQAALAAQDAAAVRREIAEVNDRHTGAAARLRLLDEHVAALRGDFDGFSAASEDRFAGFEQKAQDRIANGIASFAARIDALTANADAAERRIEHANKVLSGEIQRVEACTEAALAEAVQARKADYDALRREIEQNTASQRSELEQSGRAVRAALDQVRVKAENEIAELQSAQKSTAARMTLADSALATCSRSIEATSQKIEALSARVDEGDARYGKDSDDARVVFEDMYKRLDALESYNQALPNEFVASRLEDFKARLTVQETEAREAGERLANLARLVTKVSAQADDNATQAEDRLHKIELALADVRLDQYAAPEAQQPSAGGDVAELRDVLARALDEIELRLSALENASVAEEFTALRNRLEDRHIALESRTGRALDQLTRTIALLSKKFALEGGEEAAGPADDLAQTA